MVAPILPGCLVRGKRNMKVTLWPDYEVQECPDGNVRARMMSKTKFHTSAGVLAKTDLALVISVPFPSGRGLTGTGVVLLFLRDQQKFAYTWASYLVAL